MPVRNISCRGLDDAGDSHTVVAVSLGGSRPVIMPIHRTGDWRGVNDFTTQDGCMVYAAWILITTRLKTLYPPTVSPLRYCGVEMLQVACVFVDILRSFGTSGVAILEWVRVWHGECCWSCWCLPFRVLLCSDG